MDCDKLIEHLRECGTYGFKQEECRDAALAIETLRAENEKLRKERDEARVDCAVAEKNHANCAADLARVTAERDAAIECLKNKCPFCRKYLTCQGRTINNDCWEFFGLKED